MIQRETLNQEFCKAWDLRLEIIKNKALWQLAEEYGAEFLDLLRAFRAIRPGFAFGNFVYGLMVVVKD